MGAALPILRQDPLLNSIVPWSAGWEDRAKAGAFVAAIAYRKGAAVALVGLKTQELNGQSGVVVKELSAATGRIGVKLASRRVVAVKPANLSRT